jgi:hypothetical protein
MIREWIGGFVLGCISAHKGQQFFARIDKVDLAKLTDRQLSDFVHGRSIDWNEVKPAALGKTTICETAELPRPAPPLSRSNVQEEISLRQLMLSRGGPQVLNRYDILEHLQRWEPDAGLPSIGWGEGRGGIEVTVTTAAHVAPFTRGLLDAWMPVGAVLTFVVRP